MSLYVVNCSIIKFLATFSYHLTFLSNNLNYVGISDVVEFNDVTHCMEERLISLGILGSDSDLSSNSQFDNMLLKGINLEANMSQKKVC